MGLSGVLVVTVIIGALALAVAVVRWRNSGRMLALARHEIRVGVQRLSIDEAIAEFERHLTDHKSITATPEHTDLQVPLPESLARLFRTFSFVEIVGGPERVYLDRELLESSAKSGGAEVLTIGRRGDFEIQARAATGEIFLSPGWNPQPSVFHFLISELRTQQLFQGSLVHGKEEQAP